MKRNHRLCYTISLDPTTHRLLKRIATEERRTMYGAVQVALELYDQYRKQAEDVLETMILHPRKR